jgi:hypothetical protein
MPRINKTRSTTPPIAAPAMISTVEVLLSGEELWLVVVGDGGLTTRHEASVEGATVNMGDARLCKPLESITKNKSIVPSLTSATQV